jgi:hypothetical protein
MLIVQHYVANPTTGTSVVTTPIAQKQTAPVLPTVVQQITPNAAYISPAPTITYIPPVGATAAPNVVVDPNVVGPNPPPAPGALP